MGSVYTRAIIGETLTAGGLLLYPTPLGFTTVIRDLSVMLHGDDFYSTFFKLNINGGTFWKATCPAFGECYKQLEGRIAVDPLNEIQFVCEGGLLSLATVNCTVFQLELP